MGPQQVCGGAGNLHEAFRLENNGWWGISAPGPAGVAAAGRRALRPGRHSPSGPTMGMADQLLSFTTGVTVCSSWWVAPQKSGSWPLLCPVCTILGSTEHQVTVHWCSLQSSFLIFTIWIGYEFSKSSSCGFCLLNSSFSLPPSSHISLRGNEKQVHLPTPCLEMSSASTEHRNTTQ